jgi:replicative superfamily II helicase
MSIEKYHTVLNDLFKVEHSEIAQKLGFISARESEISYDLLLKAVGMIDELSRANSSEAKKVVVTATAILWTYRKPSWDGLKDFISISLCRSGFPPSSIMVDVDYDYQNKRHSSISSIFNQFSLTVHELNHEILVGNQKFLVSGFQKRVWHRMSQVKMLGISAPTSAGKSFIILLKAIDLILRQSGNIIYIVPTLSLVAQVAADFNCQLQNFDVPNYRICTTYSSEDKGEKRIYILTQEKAISAFSQEEVPFANIRALIVDEIQNIEKVANDDDQRAKTLYDTLIEFSHATQPDLIVLSGPRVEGLKNLGLEIFNEAKSDEEKTKESPVASFTYAISKVGNDYYFNQYSEALVSPNRIQISNRELIKGYGNSQYKDDFFKYLSQFTINLGHQAKNIIFSPTSAQARKTALKLAEFSQVSNGSSEVDSLIQYIKDTVHDRYDMSLTLPKRIVYHHGKTPSHIRAVTEHAIRNKLIDNVVCTTTLMQGVNLPAQNIVMRNPDLAIKSQKGTKPKLTNYEIANLRGRAGRLLKDFIGRTFILEENSFERTTEQAELFPETEKTLKSGYGEKFKEFKDQISRSLNSNETPSELNKEFSFLITYVRQTILKHGKKSRNRLLSVGIDMEETSLRQIGDMLEQQLTLPKEVCYRNRYWDPLDLNHLYLKRNEFSLPSNVSEDDIEIKLEVLLIKFMRQFPYYYRKHFDVSEKLLHSICITAKEWMREKTLKEILAKPYFDTADKIDARIALIQKQISFGLPMLLKPIYDMLFPQNMFLRFIEIGAYKPITRKMIELNIPRETAIELSKNYFQGFSDSNTGLEEILMRLRQIKPVVNYWIRVQLDQII